MVLITPGSQVRDLPGAFFIVIGVSISGVVDVVMIEVFIISHIECRCCSLFGQSYGKKYLGMYVASTNKDIFIKY